MLSKKYPVRNDKIKRFPQYGKSSLNIRSLNIKKDANIFYVILYFHETRFDAIVFGFVDIGWRGEEFFAQLREEIQPLIPFEKLSLPKDSISVALYLRKGSGPDGTLYKLDNFPLRFCSIVFL